MTRRVEMPLDVSQAWVSQSLIHEQLLTICRFSRCGKYVVAAGTDEHVVRWELESGQKQLLSAHRSWINALALHPNEKQLFSADFHGTIHCWPFTEQAPKPQWTIEQAHQGWIRTLFATPDGNLLSAGNDRIIKLWSGTDGRLLRTFEGHEHYVFSLAFHPDGRSFVSGDLLGKVVQWDYATSRRQRTLDAEVLHTRKDNFLADVGGVRSLQFDAAGKLLACGGMTDAKSNSFCPGKPAVLIFDWETGKLRQTLRPQHTSDGPIKGLAILSDNTIAGHAEHLNGSSSLEFWKPDNPKSMHVVKRPSGFCLDVHPDGQRLAAATFKSNGRIGNGRHSKPEEYQPHHGELAIFSLFAKPEDEAKS